VVREARTGFEKKYSFVDILYDGQHSRSTGVGFAFSKYDHNTKKQQRTNKHKQQWLDKKAAKMISLLS